jgi:hypothetical protein
MDSIKNFALSQLSGGINSTQLTATLATGQGNRFPATGAYNVVIYNASNYANAALAYQAGKAAIYRVLSRTGDILTFKDNGSSLREGQEGTTAIAHNSEGITYVVMQALTVKLLTDLQGGGIVSHTYAELATLKTGSTLVPGQLYQITDFVTKHVISYTSEIHIGTAENIIIQATAINAFSPIAYSALYPQDILEYDFDDILCEDGTTPRYGWITKRIDTTLKIECPYDFRNVIWRRWAITVSTYDAGTTYAKNDICRSASKIWKSIHNSNTGNTPSNSTAIHWTQLVDETITNCVLPDPAGYTNLGNANCPGDAAIYADFYTFVLQGALSQDGLAPYGVPSKTFKNFKQTLGYTADGVNAIKSKTGNNNVFIVDSASTEGRSFDGNWLEGCFENTFIADHIFDNRVIGDLKWGVFAANVFTVPGQDIYANVFEVKGNCVGNTFSGGSIHNNLFKDMNGVLYNSFSTISTSPNDRGFYNNFFMNCGHVQYNTFSDVSYNGIFSLYVTIGGDMQTNIFATNSGFDTIIWNICYHFQANTFITTGYISQVQFVATGTMASNITTSGMKNVIIHAAGDWSGITFTASTGTFYSTAVTALPS